MSDRGFLTEDEVLDAVTAQLIEAGWTIAARARTNQPGDDLVAERDGERIIIEAKGGGSSKEHTSRYGQPFSRGQVRHHVAMAVARALRVVSRAEASAGVAFPDAPLHREEVKSLSTALDTLGIRVFWAPPPRHPEDR
jgi:hypothetical protein